MQKYSVASFEKLFGLFGACQAEEDAEVRRCELIGEVLMPLRWFFASAAIKSPAGVFWLLFRLFRLLARSTLDNP